MLCVWRINRNNRSEVQFAIAGSRVHPDLIHREAVPLPHKARLRTSYKEKALTPDKVGVTYTVGRGTFILRRAKRCRPAASRRGALIPERRRGEAHRRPGWVGGVHPSAPITARTAASDEHSAFTRAARSAGLRFAVIPLSEAIDRENTLREG